jgi:hypothetical protein
MNEKQERIYPLTTDLRSLRVARGVLRDVVPPTDADKEKYFEMQRLLSELEESYSKKLRKLTG